MIADQYAQAYHDGREDAFTAVLIYLTLQGFHPDDEAWRESFRGFVVDGGSM